MSAKETETWSDISVSTEIERGGPSDESSPPSGSKALRFTVPKPHASLWLGKVEAKEGSTTETFEGLRGYSSEDLAMLAKKNIAIGTESKAFVDAAEELLMLAGFGPDHGIDDAKVGASEQVAQSVERALHVTENAVKYVEHLGIPLAKLGLLATGIPSPLPTGKVQKFKTFVWATKLANWGWTAFKSGKDWAGSHPPPGTMGLFASNEILRGAKNNALTFAGEGFGAYAGKTAEVAGGWSAELIGGLFAEVLAGGIAELKGGISAEVVGGAEAALKSVWGTAEVRGKEVEIGNRSKGWPWGQKATEEVKVSATETVELIAQSTAPGSTGAKLELESAHGGEVSLVAKKTSVVSSEQASVSSANVKLVLNEDAAILGYDPEPLSIRQYMDGVFEAMNVRRAALAALAGEGAARQAQQDAINQSYKLTVASLKAARRASEVAFEANDLAPRVTVEETNASMSAGTRKLKMTPTGVILELQPGISLEMTPAGVKLKSTGPLTVEAMGNTWTFGPAGLVGPGVAGA